MLNKLFIKILIFFEYILFKLMSKNIPWAIKRHIILYRDDIVELICYLKLNRRLK
jgi:hypothetical protein